MPVCCFLDLLLFFQAALCTAPSKCLCSRGRIRPFCSLPVPLLTLQSTYTLGCSTLSAVYNGMQIHHVPCARLIPAEHVAEGLSCAGDGCLAAQQLGLKDSDFQSLGLGWVRVFWIRANLLRSPYSLSPAPLAFLPGVRLASPTCLSLAEPR